MLAADIPNMSKVEDENGAFPFYWPRDPGLPRFAFGRLFGGVYLCCETLNEIIPSVSGRRRATRAPCRYLPPRLILPTSVEIVVHCLRHSVLQERLGLDRPRGRKTTNFSRTPCLTLVALERKAWAKGSSGYSFQTALSESATHQMGGEGHPG